MPVNDTPGGRMLLTRCDATARTGGRVSADNEAWAHFPMLVEFVKKAEQQQKRMAIPEGQPIPNFAPMQVRPREACAGVRLACCVCTRWQ
jgi:hypothetical protein